MPQYKPERVWFLRFFGFGTEYIFWQTGLGADWQIISFSSLWLHYCFIWQSSPSNKMAGYRHCALLPKWCSGVKKALGLYMPAIFICKKNDGGTGNLHKRLDGRFNDCITAVIGLKVQDPVPVHPMTVRMIFFYPHTGTSNIAPAEDAGIMMLCDGRSTTSTGNALTCGTTPACLFCLPGRQDCLACII